MIRVLPMLVALAVSTPARAQPAGDGRARQLFELALVAPGHADEIPIVEPGPPIASARPAPETSARELHDSGSRRRTTGVVLLASGAALLGTAALMVVLGRADDSGSCGDGPWGCVEPLQIYGLIVGAGGLALAGAGAILVWSGLRQMRRAEALELRAAITQVRGGVGLALDLSWM